VVASDRLSRLVAVVAAFLAAVVTLVPWDRIGMGPETESAWVAALVALIAGLAGLFRNDDAT
jgi:hypothetical protein